METIIKIKFPLERVPTPDPQWRHMLPRRARWFGWLYSWNSCSIQEFGGRRFNVSRRLTLFRLEILTLDRNQYHDESDKERADRYLSEWSKCEKELHGLRLIVMGEGMDAEVKKLIRDSLGIDFEEGRME